MTIFNTRITTNLLHKNLGNGIKGIIYRWLSSPKGNVLNVKLIHPIYYRVNWICLYIYFLYIIEGRLFGKEWQKWSGVDTLHMTLAIKSTKYMVQTYRSLTSSVWWGEIEKIMGTPEEWKVVDMSKIKFCFVCHSVIVFWNMVIQKKIWINNINSIRKSPLCIYYHNSSYSNHQFLIWWLHSIIIDQILLSTCLLSVLSWYWCFCIDLNIILWMKWDHTYK